MNDQRILALGKLEGAKKHLMELGVRAGSHIESLRQEIDSILFEKDYLNIDFDKCDVLIEHLKEIQKSAKAEDEKIKRLKETYNFD